MWPFKRIKRPVQGHATITWCESSQNNNGYEKRYGGVFGLGAELAGAAVGLDLDLSKGHPDTRGGGDPDPDWQQHVAQLNADYAAGKISYEEMAAGVMRATGGA